MTTERQPPIIAVASGKGGVGKTTIAVNLALALTGQGRRVGLIDADLYGPDVPRMLGLRRRVAATGVTVFAAPGAAGSRLEPVRRYGVQAISAALLLGEDQAFGVEGPLAQLLARRLITDVTWDDDVDCLVVDLPPGTADVQQHVFTQARRTVFALIVVTPQAIAHQDVRRLLADLSRHPVTIAGGVENMGAYVCPHCGDSGEMFPAAPDDDSIWATIPRLASVPFSPRAARDADQGRPVMVTKAVPEQVRAYDEVARRLGEILDET